MPIWKFLVSQLVHSWMVDMFLSRCPHVVVEMNRMEFAFVHASSRKFRHAYQELNDRMFVNISGTVQAQHLQDRYQLHLPSQTKLHERQKKNKKETQTIQY